MADNPALQQENQQPLITEPEIYLRDGQMKLYGKTTQGMFTAYIGVILNVGVDELGKPKIEVASADFGPTACGAPLPGTPAYDTFNGYVNFGSGDLNHAILINGDSLVLHLFTGLDPLRRYSFRGTVVGGVANYSNRWTRFTIVGADSFTAAHTANVPTSAMQPALAPDEAAMNTGDNRSGDVVGWDNIAPSPDGSFLILSSKYLGPAPGNARPGPLAYAPVAVRLEEVGAMPLVQITSPPDGYVVEGPTNVAITAFAKAVEGGRGNQHGQGPVPDGSSPDVGPEALRQGVLDGLQGALGLGGPPAELLKQSMTFTQQVTDRGWFFLFQRPSLISPLVESA